MKRKLGVLLFSLFSISGFSQSNEKINEPYLQEKAPNHSRVNHHYSKKSKTSAAPIWSEDFSNGIPAGWTNQGHNGNPSSPLTNAIWEYRGVSTTPDLTEGSRGAYAVPMDPINSPSASNGFVIFDSDFLDNNGIAGNFGNGTAPTPHVGELTTDTIDLSGYDNIQLTIHSYSRYFAGRNMIGFSSDGGVTWNEVRVNDHVAFNSSTSNDEVTVLNISNWVGNSQYAMLRFTFDGNFNEPAANGFGYYFWMLDDISIEELPSHELKFTTHNNAPPHDILFGGGEKTGNMLVNQVKPVSFDANILNFGADTQTTVLLNVDIYKNGVLDTTLRSDTIAQLAPGDVADFNQIFTPSFLPDGIGQYDCVFRPTSDSVPSTSGSVQAIDTAYTFWVNPLDTPTFGHSLDFRSFDNSIGTPQLGDDGSGLASRFVFPNPTDTVNGVPKVAVTHMDLRFSTLTVNGGDIILECYAATGFDFISGFGAPAIFSKTFPINSQSGTLSRFDIRNCPSSPIYLDPDSAYFFVVNMFSNGGVNTIRIANDQTVVQPGSSSIMYNSSDARWYTGYSGGSRTFASPHIRVINLADTINSGVAHVDVQTVCGSSYTWIDGNTYTSNNNTATYLASSVNGCDSIIRLDLTLASANSGTDVQIACGSLTWIDGITYTSNNNTATHTLTNVSGCDSVVTLDLTIVSPTSATDVQTACDSYTWIDGNTYTSNNNTATHTLTNVAGCDSVVSLDLTIKNSTGSTDVQSACSSFTWIDGNTYTSDTNTATHVLTNSQGCDSIIILDLTITLSDLSVSVIDSVLTANAGGLQYQWLTCGTNGSFTPIAGANSQSLTVSANGSYAVVITDGNCTDTSSCMVISNIGVSQADVFKTSIYPNPGNGIFNLKLGSQGKISLKVLDVNGKVVYEEKDIEEENYRFQLDEPAGVYMVQLKRDGNIRHHKLVIK